MSSDNIHVIDHSQLCTFSMMSICILLNSESWSSYVIVAFVGSHIIKVIGVWVYIDFPSSVQTPISWSFSHLRRD